MFENCARSANTIGAECAKCETRPTIIHKVARFLGKRLFCPACCETCAGKPAAAKQNAVRTQEYGPPAGSRDSWYRDGPEDRAARAKEAVGGPRSRWGRW